MAYRKIEDSKLKAIADAIRNKLSSTSTMTPDEMPEMIENIGIDIVPDYWTNYLKTKVTEINTALSDAGENKSAFLWYTDAHWTTNYGTSPVLLKYLSKYTGMDKTFFGGDIAVASSGEIDVITAWRSLVSGIPNHHSLIGNHDNQVTELTTAEARADFFIQAWRTGDMAIGTHATNGKMYYYIDNHIEHTRYICLSTGRMWTNVDEVQWCIEVLNATPKNWHIVVISHLWLNNDYTNGGIITTPVNYTQGYLDMFDDYNYRMSGTESFTNTTYDFARAGGKIEFIIGGHTHMDYDFTTAKGIPVILTECDAWQERDDVSVAVKGTTTESCIYAIVADYAAKIVRVINIGRGNSRNLAIPNVIMYTNQLPIATDTDGSIYNGVGYADNTRWSNSNGDYSNSSSVGWDITGYIPVKRGDVIRMKNCEFYDFDAESSKAMMAFFASDYNYVIASDTYSPENPPSSAWSPVFDDNGQLVQFTVPMAYNSSIAFIRITGHDFNADSIITVNEEIDDDSNSSGGNTIPDEGEDGGDSGVTPDIPQGNYTNVLPTATASDGSIYNGIGYKSSTRLSVSSGNFEERTESGWCSSGLIKAVAGDIIRLKNCTFTKSNPAGGTHRGGIYGANMDGSYSGQMVAMADFTSDGSSAHPVYDTDNDNIIQFTVPTSIKSPGYIRIVVQQFNEYSIITVNEEID